MLFPRSRTRFSPTRPVLALAAILAVLALLTGCAPAKAIPPAGIAFAVGVRSNSPAPDTQALSRLVPADLPVGSEVTVTGISGSPDGVAGTGFTFADQGVKADNASLLLGLRARLQHQLAAVASTSEEADVLGAIATAARGISGLPGSRTLVISDSMLSTAGIVRFQDGLLTASAEDVVAAIPAKDLPDLSGITKVIVVGQGNVVSPQPALGTDRSTVREIWSAILRKSGATKLAYQDQANGTAAASGLPAVTVVKPTEQDPLPVACTQVVPQYRIQFRAGQSSFVDPASATTALTRVATALRGCRGPVTIDGTTSSEGTVAANQELSLQRAERVRTLMAPLLRRAVSSIAVRGLGSDFPGFVEDTSASGTLDPVLAGRNRKVIIRIGS